MQGGLNPGVGSRLVARRVVQRLRPQGLIAVRNCTDESISQESLREDTDQGPACDQPGRIDLGPGKEHE